MTLSAFLEYCTCEQRIEPNRKSKTRSEDWILVERWLAVLGNCNYTSRPEYDFSQRHKMLSLSSRFRMHSVDVTSLSRPKQSASLRHKNRSEIGVLCVKESPILVSFAAVIRVVTTLITAAKETSPIQDTICFLVTAQEQSGIM